MNGFGKLRRCTERDAAVVDLYFSLDSTFVGVRALLRRARQTYRRLGRPTTTRLK